MREIWKVMDNNEILRENKGKKFDIILSNPPFNRNLHLKFLEKYIQLANKVISIQPVRWLEDISVEYIKSSNYNKYKESISKHIKDLELITAEDSKKYFNILLQTNLGIYVCNKTGGFDYESLSKNSILKKVIDYIYNNKCNFEYDKKDGYRVRVPFITAGKARGSGNRSPHLTSLNCKDIVFKDGKYNDKWWYEYYMKNQYSKQTEEITSSIQFNSEEEGHNFVKSVQDTDFGRYIESKLIVAANIDNKKILWMGNAKHPRTSEIGYKAEWTDEDFDKFFNLTEEEINEYHKYIKDFEEKRRKWFEEKDRKYPENRRIKES